MALKAALVGQGGTAQGVLQAGDGFVVARTFGCVRGVLTVVLQERLDFCAANIKRTGEIKGNIGRVVGPGLAVFIRPVIEQLPLVGAFFGHLDCGFLHKSQKVEAPEGTNATRKVAPTYHAPALRAVDSACVNFCVLGAVLAREDLFFILAASPRSGHRTPNRGS